MDRIWGKRSHVALVATAVFHLFFTYFCDQGCDWMVGWHVYWQFILNSAPYITILNAITESHVHRLRSMNIGLISSTHQPNLLVWETEKLNGNLRSILFPLSIFSHYDRYSPYHLQNRNRVNELLEESVWGEANHRCHSLYVLQSDHLWSSMLLIRTCVWELVLCPVIYILYWLSGIINPGS